MLFDKVGKMGLGTRLRLLSELMLLDAEKVYALYDVPLKPKWFPVFYVLSESESALSITEIAQEISQSHPAVIKTVKEMSKQGLVLEKKDKTDGRRNNVSLTEKGKEAHQKIQYQYEDVGLAVELALQKTTHNLWVAVEEFEFLLQQKSLYLRVLEQKKLRETKKVKIVSYAPKYRETFQKLNEDWIKEYFKMEESDRKSLGNPETYIFQKRGTILVALYENKPVGVCALIKLENHKYDYELSKMAIAPHAQGKGIGWLLGQAIVEEAKDLGASSLYLESNTILKPAISLYQKLGFEKVSGVPSPYERSNIQMALELT